MVDTLKFKIPLSPITYELIKSHSIEVTKFDNNRDLEIFRITTSELNIGSYDRKITIFISDPGYCFLEFSLPKFILGHNVFLLYPEEIIESLELLRNLLVNKFGDFTDLKKWIVYRIDLCYAWKFESQKEAVKMLNLLQKFNFPRKIKFLWGDESVMWKGDSYSVKFYLKQPEFYKHDFKILRDMGNIELAYRMFNWSEGVLRFEISLRKRFLDDYFDGDISIKNIPVEFYEDNLKKIFEKLLGGFKIKFIKNQEIKDRLVLKYGVKRGGRLFMFYTFFRSQGKKIIDFYSREHIWRKLRCTFIL